MTSDHLYDLMRQLVQEDASLHHIQNDYLNDSSDCSDCQTFWKKMVTDKEEHVKELESMIKSHMSAGA